MDHLLSPQLYQKIAQNAPYIDHEGCFPEQEFKLIAEAGLLEIVLPGNSLDFEQRKNQGLLTLLKTIGKASLPVGRIYEGHINALYLVYLLGKTEQKQRWFADVILGKKMFSVWNTQDSEGLRIYDLGNGNYIVFTIARAIFVLEMVKLISIS